MESKNSFNVKVIIEQLKSYCALQDKCQWDIKQKMKAWNLPKTTQNYILALLIKEKYIDEERFSKSFCRGKFKIKKWGRIKITNELKKKNISELCILKGLQEISEEEYTKEIEIQYQKKYSSTKEKHYLIKRKKIATYLLGKGYENNLVWNKIRELSKKIS